MKPKILIVNDETTHLKMLETVLSDEGYLIHLAEDGQTAIAAVEERFYDLILMDKDIGYQPADPADKTQSLWNKLIIWPIRHFFHRHSAIWFVIQARDITLSFRSSDANLLLHPNLNRILI